MRQVERRSREKERHRIGFEVRRELDKSKVHCLPNYLELLAWLDFEGSKPDDVHLSAISISKFVFAFYVYQSPFLFKNSKLKSSKLLALKKS